MVLRAHGGGGGDTEARIDCKQVAITSFFGRASDLVTASRM